MLFEAARDFERAAEYFLAAAQQAAADSANTEAVVLARRGLAAVELLPESLERSQRELQLQTTLGPALMSTVGYGAPEVEAAYIRARELCRQIGDVPQFFTVIYGLYQVLAGEGGLSNVPGAGRAAADDRAESSGFDAPDTGP